MCDNNKINTIEQLLKSDPTKLSDNDLIYYLKCKTNNDKLKADDLDSTKKYLNQIPISFAYENIFINTSNYGTITMILIGLLIPFYYFYPRFYKIGFIGIFIGIISFFSLFSKINNLYNIFFKNVGIFFIGLTLIIYILFFILLNKLNHVSLFFISAILSYLLISYFIRFLLTIPTKNNPWNKYSASLNNNNNYTEYNLLLETCCFQIIDRYKLKLPSGNMLYSYLTQFNIGENPNKLSDFFTNLFGPIISLLLLWFLSYFLGILKYENMNLFPLIGILDDSKKYFTCEANYILPKELNVGLLIHDHIDQYNFDDSLYYKVEKALLRISKELLLKYNPKFFSIENDEIYKNFKNNKIFKQILKILDKNKLKSEELKLKFSDIRENEIRNIIYQDEIPFKEKQEMLDLIDHIKNTLQIINEVKNDYENDALLARDELLYDKDIKEEQKNKLSDIMNDYIKKFTDNLNLKDGILFGYHYNIIGYKLFGDNIRLKSNYVFSFILQLISTWLLLAKPLGSPWLIIKYILSENEGMKNFIHNLQGNGILWKYFSTGLDRSYFEEIYKNMPNNNDKNMIIKIKNIIYTFFLFILFVFLLYFYNSTVFGLNISPSWYNLLYQVIFMLVIFGNLYTYNKIDESDPLSRLLPFNRNCFIIFFAIFIIIYFIISLIQYNK